MEFRLWIGLWTAFFVFMLAAFNLSFLVKFITRFTEDCFATLVAIIFIIDAIKNTVKLKRIKQTVILTTLPPSAYETTTIAELPAITVSSVIDNVVQTTTQLTQNELMTSSKLVDDAKFSANLQKEEHEKNFYFSLIIFLMTFIICIGLKTFRNRAYMPSKVNSFECLNFFFLVPNANKAHLFDLFTNFVVSRDLK